IAETRLETPIRVRFTLSCMAIRMEAKRDALEGILAKKTHAESAEEPSVPSIPTNLAGNSDDLPTKNPHSGACQLVLREF
ncbi:MAG: hypothetical protein ABI824_03165, partial [Acidobacteriota bacterium]